MYVQLNKVLAAYAFAVLTLHAISGARGQYDPLVIPEKAQMSTTEFTVHDTARQRDIPLRVYLPSAHTQHPVVLFSHGLGGTRSGCAYLGRHWAARGFVAVFLQHVGSDDSVWRNAATCQAAGGVEASRIAGKLLTPRAGRSDRVRSARTVEPRPRSIRCMGGWICST